MKLHRQLLSALLLSAPLALSAESIDAQQALALAAQQLESTPEALTLVYTATDSATGEPTFFAFNREGGGFALVAADDRVDHVVLGYNHVGAFDYAALPDNARHWIDGYSVAVSSVRRQGTDQLAKRAPRRVTTTEGVPRYVKPLIGMPNTATEGYIAWGQGYPFSNLCPTMLYGGKEQPCVTGCVATAMAMVMFKHKHPTVGTGSSTYIWNGQTLTANFEHEYYWDSMLYRYSVDQASHTDYFSAHEADAVATLMRDCGYSVRMIYDNVNGSGAAEENVCKALVNNFSYDRGVGHLGRDFCSTQYWEDLLRHEIAEGRPVCYAGGSDYGAHEFVCDGYDANGLFFFHWGWYGALDGYYATLDCQGYNSGQTIVYGIKPAGATPSAASILAGSNQHFLWKEDNRIKSNVRFFTPLEGVEADIAVAVENTATHEVKYELQQSFTTSDVNNKNTQITDFTVTGTYPAGTYDVYPVYRRSGAKDWNKVLFGDYQQDRVTLTVSGGVQTFSNDNIVEVIDEGRVKVDGICYILDIAKHTATVTYQNSGYNSYSGIVTVPSTVEYEGTTYTITAIGQRAFSDCVDLEKVEVGSEVTSIAYGAFNLCSAETITFAEGSKLRNIENYAFNGAKLTSIVFPEGLTNIGSNVFNSCNNLVSISLPASLTGMGAAAFNYCLYLEDVWVSSATPLNLSVSNTPFEGINDYWLAQCRLHVPKGSKAAYEANEVWHKFNIVEREDGELGPDTPDPGTGGNSDQPIPGTYSIQLYGTDYYFSTAQVEGYSMTTCSLSDKPEYFYIEPATGGGYTITSAKNDHKIGYSSRQGDGLSVQDVCDVASTWTIEDLNGGMTRILRKSSSVGLGADGYDYASAVYTNQSASLNINCYWTLTKVEGDPVLATAIELSEEEATLKVGETLTVSATISPANATKKTVTWETTNAAVATVSSNGVITAVGPGEATILATTTDGSNKTAFLVVTVTQKETPVDPDPETPVDPEPDESRLKYFIQLQGSDLYFSTNLVDDHQYKTYSLSSTPEPFYIEPTDGGYTITSALNGKRVGFSTTTAGSLSTWDFCDAESTWVIDNVEGEPTRILKKNYDVGFGADTAADGQGVYTDKKEPKCTHCTWVITPAEELETVYTFSPSTDATRYFSTDEFIEKGRPTYCLSSTPEYFRVKKVDGGYTIQSTKTGQYAGISTDKHWDFADEPTVWNISALTGTVSILRATGETTKGFGWDSDGSTYTDKEDMQWTINAVPYSGDSAGLVANMVRRAIGGKCGKADVEATVQSVLQKSAAE